MSFERLFADQAHEYAKYRPTYPKELFAYLAELAPSQKLAIDCGTGNGQAAVALAEHFERVHAFDPSEQQLMLAKSHARVTYVVGRDETIDCDDISADLVTVAQALHWFRHDKFFREVERVLRPQGVFAAWCYQMCTVNPQIDEVINHFYHVTTDPFWAPQRTLVDEGYRSIVIPFRETTSPPTFRMSVQYNVEQLLGYLSSWSAVQECRRKEGRDLVNEVRPQLERAWGNLHEKYEVSWPLSMRIGIKEGA